MRHVIPNIDIEQLTDGQNQQYNTRDYYVTETQIQNLLRYYPVRQNCYQLAFCISGNITVSVNGKEIYYDTNTFAAFTPSTIINVLQTSEDYRCVVVIFQKNFLIETLNNIYFLERFQLLNNGGTPYMRLEEKESSKFVEQAAKIRMQMEDTEHAFRRDIIRSLIIILLYEAERIYLKQHPHDYKDIKRGKDKTLSQFQELIRKHFYRQHGVSFYANELHITTEQLSKLLKEATGKTAKEHIDEMILSQAKVLLNSGKYNVSEVASLLYYENLEEFSRFFKRKTGTSPLRFAKAGH